MTKVVLFEGLLAGAPNELTAQSATLESANTSQTEASRDNVNSEMQGHVNSEYTTQPNPDNVAPTLG